MRAAIALVTVGALAGCSGLYMPNVAFNDQSAPFPSNYAQMVMSYGRYNAGEAQIAPPAKFPSWSVYEPSTWYVCAKAGGGPHVFIIEGKRISDDLVKGFETYCKDAVYLTY